MNVRPLLLAVLCASVAVACAMPPVCPPCLESMLPQDAGDAGPPPVAQAPDAGCPAQPMAPPDILQEAHLQPLQFLVGQWEGSGWIQLGPSEREEFHQQERVETRLDGAVLTIEGTGTAAADGGVERVIHRAFALIRFDPALQAVRFSSFLSDGRTIEGDAQVAEGSLGWGYQHPRAGRIRYAIQLTPEGKWHETGERSADGVTWYPFFEMTLEKRP